MIIALMAARQRDAERIRRDEARIDELLSLQKAAMAAEKERDDYKRLAGNLSSKITALEELLNVRNKDLYAGKSQKGIHKKKREIEEDHTCGKDDFDGTPQSLGPSLPQSGEARARGEEVETKSEDARLYRQGLSYRTMSADNTVCHNSDIRRLPAGAIIMKRFRKYAYEQISRLVEHDYEVIRYKTPEGKIHEGYFPFIGQPEIIDVVPGTHASGSFLAYLAFNKYVLKTKVIIIKLRSKLDILLRDAHPPRRELMHKVINYMDTFWTQLFAYLNDGSYSIDNSIAERFIRPLAGERKNSLFFGSDRMARVSAVYHTIISTCKIQGVSVLAYFKKFFSEIIKGRRDYEHLLPLTIGLN